MKNGILAGHIPAFPGAPYFNCFQGMTMEKTKFFKSPYFWLIMLLPLGGVVYAAARYLPGFAGFYSAAVYPAIAGFFGSITGALPFSIMEIVIAAGIFLAVFWPVQAALAVRKGQKTVSAAFGGVLLKIISAASAVLFLFVIFCGVNYYRPGFADTVGLEVRDSSVDELYELCSDLLDEANALSTQLEHASDGTTLYPKDNYTMAKEACRGYSELCEEYEFLRMGAVTFGRPKPVFFSVVMSYLQISGVYSPYTVEANVCTAGPDFLRGATMMHEQTHLRGFMIEAEANFVAYLACMESGDPYFEYSGTSLALLYSMNALYEVDPERCLELRARYCEALDADMRAQSDYVHAYDTKIAEVSDSINDTYLKLNAQQDGVRSYGKMVDLLLAYWREK